ncbi:MAG: septum formation inhibitor Maf [Acidimicrobiia bacterium]|nr:septum formation inhibitor Maf [Acidimicrobiia bacterium]
MPGVPDLVLASSSPRRRALLDALGLAFEVTSPDVDESLLPNEDPATYVERVAIDKARAGHEPGDITLAADTTVVLEGIAIAKPHDTAEAEAMLSRLQGRTHRVLTGVALATPSGLYSTVEGTSVTMAEMTPDEIAWYVGTGEPMDKAGAYALQGIGGTFVRGVNGDAFNVIGLPLLATRRLFAEAGLDLFSFRA